MRKLLLALSLTLTTALAACGGDDTGSAQGCEVKVSADTAAKPTITVPSCEAPTALQTKDIVEGTGAAAKAGDAVSVQYAGVSWSTKKQFDASWDRGGEPFTVQPLGMASVIKGWNQGLVGVKQGGRRLLVIPPSLGYGTRGAGADIKPNETLVFVVDVVGITSGAQ